MGAPIAAAIGCAPYQRGTSISARNKRRTEARAAAPRLWWGPGGAAAPSARAPPLHTRGLVAGEARAAGTQPPGPYAQPQAEGGRQRAGVRAPPLGDNQRSHLNAPRSARGRRRPGPRAEGRVPRPRLPGPALSPARFPGALKVDRGGSPSRPLGSLSPTRTARSTQLSLGARSALGLIGSGDRLPTCDLPARAICISHHAETHTHAHTRTDRTEAHRGGGEKETREPAQIGTCGWF